MKLQIEWYKLSKKRSLENVSSQIIVDHVLLYVRTFSQLIAYFRTLLGVLKHHRATLKPKKCKWFQDKCDFIGMNVAAGGTQLAQSKNEAFSNLEQPNIWGELHMIIGLFGFYRQFLPLYKLDVRPCRYILSKHPQPRTLSQN